MHFCIFSARFVNAFIRCTEFHNTLYLKYVHSIINGGFMSDETKIESARLIAAREKAAKALAAVKKLEADEKKRAAAQKSRESKAERAKITRQKILLGALTESLMQTDAAFRAQIMQKLDVYLTKDRDRAVFDLKSKNDDQAFTDLVNAVGNN